MSAKAILRGRPLGVLPLARPPARTPNQTAVRILRVLAAFLERPGSGYRVSELCKRLEIPKQAMIRALQALLEEGYVCRAAQGAGYELGYRMLEIGHFDRVEPDLLEIALPAMQRMHALTAESVSLAARAGDTTTVLGYLDGRWPLTGRIRKGRPMALNIGPVSRTVLACLSDDEINDFIARHNPLPAMTANAVTDPIVLWDEIRATRARGYGQGIVIPGVAVLGFPIFGADDRPHGALSVIGSSDDIYGPRVQAALPALLRIMEELNVQTRLLPEQSALEIAL